jgi:hypothetical protein
MSLFPVEATMPAPRSLFCLYLPALLAAGPPLDGNAVIRGKAGDSEIVITTTARLAGAIHSLKFRGKEHIDSFDHGRQLQSAVNLDCGKALRAETFNPTEAGSRADGTGPRSSSKLLALTARGNELTSRTRMAFWLKPGEKSEGHAAYNDAVLSNHVLTRRVRIGFKDMPNVLDYRVTFTVPKGEKHTHAVFEALTGYMPAEFERFWKFDPDRGKLVPLDDGPGEQGLPVVLATRTGSHALGIFSPDQVTRGIKGLGYGRWRFRAEKVVKWNCVFRVSDRKGIRAGDYTYQMYVVVGTTEECQRGLKKLHELLRAP